MGVAVGEEVGESVDACVRTFAGVADGMLVGVGTGSSLQALSTTAMVRNVTTASQQERDAERSVMRVLSSSLIGESCREMRTRPHDPPSPENHAPATYLTTEFDDEAMTRPGAFLCHGDDVPIESRFRRRADCAFRAGPARNARTKRKAAIHRRPGKAWHDRRCFTLICRVPARFTPRPASTSGPARRSSPERRRIRTKGSPGRDIPRGSRSQPARPAAHGRRTGWHRRGSRSNCRCSRRILLGGPKGVKLRKFAMLVSL